MLCQFCASTTVFITFITKSYERKVTQSVLATEVTCCYFFLLHLIFSLIANELSARYTIGFECWLDAFTIVPLLMQTEGGSWLTLAYLRAYRMKRAFDEIAEAGVLRPYMGALTILIIRKLITFINVLTTIAGTELIFESLGDIKGFADSYYSAEMGGVSFFQSNSFLT